MTNGRTRFSSSRLARPHGGRLRVSTSADACESSNASVTYLKSMRRQAPEMDWWTAPISGHRMPGSKLASFSDDVCTPSSSSSCSCSESQDTIPGDEDRHLERAFLASIRGLERHLEAALSPEPRQPAANKLSEDLNNDSCEQETAAWRLFSLYQHEAWQSQRTDVRAGSLGWQMRRPPRNDGRTYSSTQRDNSAEALQVDPVSPDVAFEQVLAALAPTEARIAQQVSSNAQRVPQQQFSEAVEPPGRAAREALKIIVFDEVPEAADRATSEGETEAKSAGSIKPDQNESATPSHAERDSTSSNPAQNAVATQNEVDQADTPPQVRAEASGTAHLVLAELEAAIEYTGANTQGNHDHQHQHSILRYRPKTSEVQQPAISIGVDTSEAKEPSRAVEVQSRVSADAQVVLGDQPLRHLASRQLLTPCPSKYEAACAAHDFGAQVNLGSEPLRIACTTVRTIRKGKRWQQIPKANNLTTSPPAKSDKENRRANASKGTHAGGQSGRPPNRAIVAVDETSQCARRGRRKSCSLDYSDPSSPTSSQRNQQAHEALARSRHKAQVASHKTRHQSRSSSTSRKLELAVQHVDMAAARAQSQVQEQLRKVMRTVEATAQEAKVVIQQGSKHVDESRSGLAAFDTYSPHKEQALSRSESDSAHALRNATSAHQISIAADRLVDSTDSAGEDKQAALKMQAKPMTVQDAELGVTPKHKIRMAKIGEAPDLDAHVAAALSKIEDAKSQVNETVRNVLKQLEAVENAAAAAAAVRSF